MLLDCFAVCFLQDASLPCATAGPARVSAAAVHALGMYGAADAAQQQEEQAAAAAAGG
jgi:hypothetical protein